MKYKLIIDKNAEEEIIAVVHSPSELTRRIEDVVRDFRERTALWGIRKRKCESSPSGK